MRTPLFARAGADQGASARRSRKGHRHRDDLHVRRRHRRHLVARAVAAGAGDHSSRTARYAGDVGRCRLGIGRPGGGAAALRRPGGTVGDQGPRADRRAPARRAAISSAIAKPITHHVKFYEKGDRPLEIVTSRQWFFKTMAFREELLARGRELAVASRAHARALRELGERPHRRLVRQPPALFRRAVSGVVPRATTDGTHELRRAAACPTRRGCRSIRQPTCPEGFTADQRGVPGGFVGDPDIMDTWATSSLTPFIVCGWEQDADLWRRTFPMDLRPQAHDIIRTWLFSSVLRAHLDANSLPWNNAAISGWVLDPDRKKMSKSKGNVVTPMGLLERARIRRGALLGGQGRAGRRHGVRSGADAGGPPACDQGAERVEVRARQTCARRGGDRIPSIAACSRASPRWSTRRRRRSRRTTTRRPCARSRRSSGGSATTTSSTSSAGAPARAPTPTRRLRRALTSLSVMLRLFAPFLPFVTEEVWSWWQTGSIHRAAWPAIRGDPRRARRRPRRRRGPGRDRGVGGHRRDPPRTRRSTSSPSACQSPPSAFHERGESELGSRARRRAGRQQRRGRRRDPRRRGAGDVRRAGGLMSAALLPAVYEDLVRRALAEDIGAGDITTTAIVPPSAGATAALLAKSACVVAGLDVAREVFHQVDRSSAFTAATADGDDARSRRRAGAPRRARRRDADRGAHGAQFPAAPHRHRDVDAPVRRRRRRAGRRPRHAQDDADAARAREVRRPLRRRHQPSRRRSTRPC